MSNPLLRPNDPRFSKPSLLDAQGKNLFSEGDGIVAAKVVGDESSAVTDENVYSPSVEIAPYQPRFEVSQSHRGVLLLVLAITGLAGALCGISSLSGWWVLGWIPSFLAVIPAGCAVGLGWQDLRAIQMGAMDPKGHGLTQIAFWLGALGVFASLAMDAAVIFFVIYFVMSLV